MAIYLGIYFNKIDDKTNLSYVYLTYVCLTLPYCCPLKLYFQKVD